MKGKTVYVVLDAEDKLEAVYQIEEEAEARAEEIDGEVFAKIVR